jgi:hypothetical protein
LQKIITLRFLKLIQKQRTFPTKVSSKRNRTKIHQLFYPKKLPSSHNKNINFNRKKCSTTISFLPQPKSPKRITPQKTTKTENNQKTEKKALTNQTAGPNPPPHLRRRERERERLRWRERDRELKEGERERASKRERERERERAWV